MRRKRRYTWLEGVTYVAGQNYLMSTPTNFNGGYLQLPLISSSQIEEDLDGNGTLIRVVGDLYVQLSNATGAPTVDNYPWSVGLMELQEDQTGAASVTMGVMNPTGNEFSWLWNKTNLWCDHSPSGDHVTWPTPQYNAGFGKTPTADTHGWTANLDIKVRRKLRTGRPLSFIFDMHFINNANVTCVAYGAIRALCAH